MKRATILCVANYRNTYHKGPSRTTLKQIASLGRKLSQFLLRFAGCFVRTESRACFRDYVRGQMSGIQRKNCEAIALESQSKCRPRTLQRFLESMSWDEERVRDRCQQIIASEYD
ncbi:MAG: transposase, partial [Planctomycetales bacterium]|nr:transposase [Planctomycetales bacterium]